MINIFAATIVQDLCRCMTGLAVMLCLVACHTSSVIQSAPLPAIEQTARLVKTHQTYVGFGTRDQELFYQPIVTDDAVYINGYHGRLYTLDTQLHRQHVFDLDTPLVSGLGKLNAQLFTVTRAGYLLVFDLAASRMVLREFLGGQVLHRPVFSEDGLLVFLQLNNGRMLAMNSLTGTVRWDFINSLPVLHLRGAGKPVTADGLVYFGSPAGKIHALDQTTGNLIWENFVSLPQGSDELTGMVDVHSQPVIRGDKIFISNYQGNIAAYERFTGTLLWRYAAGSYRDLLADEQWLYVVTDQDHVLALDQSSGALMWQQDQLAFRELTSPERIEESLVLGDAQGYLHLIHHQNGQLQGRYRVSTAAIKARPVVKNLQQEAAVYVLSADGFITRLMLQ